MQVFQWYRSLNGFQKTSLITIVLTFFLIIVGSLVRVSGAGLGCPDWPRCFGMWIPPTSASELPAGYDAAAFNPVHTWMEYFNRLVGVLVGFMITLTFIRSVFYRKQAPAVFYTSAVAFVLVLFQGWLGGQVVQSGLTAWVITTHMIVALLIVNVLVYAFFQAMSDRLQYSLNSTQKQALTYVVLPLLIVTLVQIVLGAQVREAIEGISNAYPALERAAWIAEVGWVDFVHRSVSWVVLGFGIWLWYRSRNYGAPPAITRLSMIINGLIILQFFGGVILVYFGLPPAFMTLHLFAASLLITFQFLFWMMVRYSRTPA